MNLKPTSITLALSLLLSPALPQAEPINKIELPEMGDSTGTLISPAEEMQFGEAFYRSLHSQVLISQDAEIQQYIESIGQRLTVNSDNPGHPFHFFVVLDKDINAFAGPGGYIGVNSGLILTTEAESELAAVLSHEIAHVTQRHLYRAYEAEQKRTIPNYIAAAAAIALTMTAGKYQGGQGAGVPLAAAMAYGVQFQIDFTRENEAEADRVGMQTLVASQYDPRSMPAFFERLQQSSRYAGQNIPEFLRTHPVTVSRISDTRGRAESYPYKQYGDSLNYQLAKAKLRVLTDTNSAETQKFFQLSTNQGTPEQRTVARYGLGLVALSTQRFKEAEEIFQQLAKEHPDQPQYMAALARTSLESRNYTQALVRYKSLSELFPDNDAIKLEYISSLLKTGKPEQAKTALFSLATKTQQQPIFFQLLAKVYSDLNQLAESHRYLAEYYYATGQTQDAIQQIKLAQTSKGLNPQLTAIIDDRLRFFMDQIIEAKRNQ
jgi:predicted Zn-dependent protease